MSMRTRCLIVLSAATLGLAAQPAQASGPWYVAPNGNDANDCLSPATPCASINAALAKADPGDTIFVATGVYTGVGNEVVRLNKDASLSGSWDAAFVSQSGASVIDGQLVRRGMFVGNNVTATVERFTVTNGNGRTGGFIFIGGGIGNAGNLTLSDSTVTKSVFGGISNNDTLVLNNSTVSDNTNNISAGGIDSVNATAVTLNNSTVSGNIGTEGGGIRIQGGGTLTLNNSTISGNLGGWGGGIRNFNTLILNNSTITGNVANNSGGGINSSGNALIQNSIVAGNVDLSSWPYTFSPDCLGIITSGGHNLLGNDAGCSFNSTTGDQIGTSSAPIDPLLGPLLDNGGPTFTHALLTGSPAIDGGNPYGCTDEDGNLLTTDQRGVARPQGLACDIGAYEFRAIEIDIKPGSFPNSINPNSKDVIPVAILTTEILDAQSVDPSTVMFGPNGASIAHSSAHLEDVDGDGDLDLLLHFRTREAGIQCDETEASLVGETFDGTVIQGSDSVNTVGCK